VIKQRGDYLRNNTWASKKYPLKPCVACGVENDVLRCGSCNDWFCMIHVIEHGKIESNPKQIKPQDYEGGVECEDCGIERSEDKMYICDSCEYVICYRCIDIHAIECNFGEFKYNRKIV
jgi:hypothetical protein